MRHREDDVLRLLEQHVERGGDPLRRLHPALTPTGALGVRRLGPRPRPVVVERAALEGAEADLVELGHHDTIGVATVEDERERLLRAHEPRRDTEVDLLAGKRLPQGARLLDPLSGEPLARGNRADTVGDVRRGVSVADEQQALQNNTLRYSSTCSIPTVS